jgi:integrase
MKSTRSFRIFIWINKAKGKDGSAPIYARITINGKRAEISLQREVLVAHWDTRSKRTTQRTAEGRALNHYLDQQYAKLLECHTQLTAGHAMITAQSVKAKYLGQEETDRTLMDVVAYHKENMGATLKPGTLKNYDTTEKYLKKFLTQVRKCNDIYLKQLSYSFIVDFEQFLRKGDNLRKAIALNNNGIMKHLERLKKLMNLALDLEWLDKHPFARYKLKFKPYRKAFLTEQELQQLEEGTITNTGYRLARDIFVFACYTGLSYTDVRQLKESNISRGIDGAYWIFTHREKNEQPVRIPLLQKALQIVQKYKDHPKTVEGALLPVYANQKINQYLKQIMIDLGIPKNISFHSARHTFATTVTLGNGVPIETVSKLLGHTKLSTTQVYARVLEQKISTDMGLLRDKIETRPEPLRKGL